MSNSIQPRKQRKSRYEAPLHERQKFMHVHLGRELRARLGITRRAMLVRKGDKVRLRRGDDAGKTGSVMEVNYRDSTLLVEGVVSKTAKGVEKMRPIAPGALEIIDGDFTRKDRVAIMARGKKKTGTKAAMAATTPVAAKTAPVAPAKN